MSDRTLPSKPFQVQMTDALTAMVVDDSKVNRVLLRQYLKRLGVRTCSTNSLARARQLFKQRQPQLVLLDLHLGNQLSLDFAQEIQTWAANSAANEVLSAIFIVTADSSFTCDHSQPLKLAGVLKKPLEFDEFERALTPYLPQLLQPGLAASHTAVTSDDFSDLRVQLQKMFFEQLPDQLNLLQASSERGDHVSVRIIAHRLRGSSANAGLSDIAANMARLEDHPELCSATITMLKSHCV